MLFAALSVGGVFRITPERRMDSRGYFARVLCEEELQAEGLCGRFVQVNTGFSPKPFTLRGIHYQEGRFGEVKVVRCTRGRVFDVAVDLRPASPTFCQYVGLELSADSGEMLYIPEGCAHGYLTLSENTELEYFTSRRYEPAAARGVRYDDPAFAIKWPAEARVVSQADLSWPAYSMVAAGRGS
jgi:dTDP-4-dehydrorhamnose 3,5-epimerase